MELEKRVEELEKKVAELEGLVQVQPKVNTDKIAEAIYKNIIQSLSEASHDISQEYHK